MRKGRILKLTSANDTNNGIDIYIDVEQIIIFESNSGDGSYILLRGSFTFVKENPNQIFEMIKAME